MINEPIEGIDPADILPHETLQKLPGEDYPEEDIELLDSEIVAVSELWYDLQEKYRLKSGSYANLMSLKAEAEEKFSQIRPYSHPRLDTVLTIGNASTTDPVYSR